jgi:hypothetical protein
VKEGIRLLHLSRKEIQPMLPNLVTLTLEEYKLDDFSNYVARGRDGVLRVLRRDARSGRHSFEPCQVVDVDGTVVHPCVKQARN